MSAVPPEGEFYFLHSGLRTSYFEPTKPEHFYKNMLVEVVYNDVYDGNYLSSKLDLPRHPRAGSQTINPVFYDAQRRYEYMYVCYGKIGKENKSKRIRLWAHLTHGSSRYSGNAPWFVYVILPMPTSEEEWIWLDLTFPIRGIYIPKAHLARPDLRDRCAYYSLQMSQRYVGVKRWGWGNYPKWYFNRNPEKGWWVSRYDNHHPQTETTNWVKAHTQARLSVGINVGQLAMELALLNTKFFDGNYQRVYDDCLLLATIADSEGAPRTWNMQNSGPDGSRVASKHFATGFTYEKVDPAWLAEVLKGAIEFGASMVPVVGPILAVATHMLLEVALNPDSFSTQSNLLGNIAGVMAAVSRVSAMAKPLLRKDVLANFQKLLNKRNRSRQRPGAAKGTRKPIKPDNKKSGGDSITTGEAGGAGIGVVAGLTQDDGDYGDDDFELEVDLMLDDPNYQVDDPDTTEDNHRQDLEKVANDIKSFFDELGRTFDDMIDWKEVNLGKLTDDIWNSLTGPALDPGSGDDKVNPAPDEPPIESLLAGGCSDFELDERGDGTYLLCTIIDMEGDGSSSEIRLDDHIGSNNGKFLWGGVDFSRNAQYIQLYVSDTKVLLRASLESDDGDWADHSIDLVGGLGLKNDELVVLDVSDDLEGGADEGDGEDDEEFGEDFGDEDGEDESEPEKESEWTPRLDAGGILKADDWLVADCGTWTLLMQTDGNLVLYLTGKAYWHSNTNTRQVGGADLEARLEEDGNFVVARVDGGDTLWESGSGGYGAVKPYLIVEDDGNVRLYDEEVPGCHWSARD